jgi:NADH dehydrogenase
MRVAIIGGTGFVGSHLVDALLAAGHAVSMLVRDGSNAKAHRASECLVVTGDLDDEDALDRLLAGCDAVIYSVGILREIRRQGVTFEALQYEGVVRTVEAARKANVSRFLLISANGVRVPGTPYQETKKRAEDVVLSSGLDATVLQPSVVFGDPRGRMEFATQLFQDMVAPPLPAIEFFQGISPSRGPILMSPVLVTDVADAVLATFANDETIGKAYPLGGPEILTWREMICRVAAAVGRRKLFVPMPVKLMMLAASLLDRMPTFPVTRDQLQMLIEGNTADPSIIETLIRRAPKKFDVEHLAYLRSGSEGREKA